MRHGTLNMRRRESLNGSGCSLQNLARRSQQVQVAHVSMLVFLTRRTGCPITALLTDGLRSDNGYSPLDPPLVTQI